MFNISFQKPIAKTKETQVGFEAQNLFYPLIQSSTILSLWRAYNTINFPPCQSNSTTHQPLGQEI